MSILQYNVTEIKQLLADCKRKYPEHFCTYENFNSVTLDKNGSTDETAIYLTDVGQTIYVFVDSTDNQPVASFDL